MQFIRTVCIIISILFSISAAEAQQSLPLNAKSALVYDADSDEVLYQKDSAGIRPIASITKLMTAVVTLEAGLDMSEQILITEEDVANTMVNKKPSGSSLPAGSVLTREELLRLTLMNSQNRAASALARTYPGGTELFVRAMNDEAQSIGMVNTTYVDPTGLYNDNVSSANDLAILLTTAQNWQEIKDFSTAREYSPNEVDKTYSTTNRLLATDSWNISLQKTGYIKQAGRCMVMLTQVAYKNVIIVLLNTTSPELRARDATLIKYWLENDALPSHKTLLQLTPYKHNTKIKRR